MRSQMQLRDPAAVIAWSTAGQAEPNSTSGENVNWLIAHVVEDTINSHSGYGNRTYTCEFICDDDGYHRLEVIGKQAIVAWLDNFSYTYGGREWSLTYRAGRAKFSGVIYTD